MIRTWRFEWRNTDWKSSASIKYFHARWSFTSGRRRADHATTLEANGRLNFRYVLLDIRDFETAELLSSSRIEDNLLAILTRLQNHREVIRAVLGRIAHLEEAERRSAFAQLLIISGLRRLGQAVKEEAQKMPILNDILDHDLLGPAIMQGRREGLQEGREEGRREGRQEGRQEGSQMVLRRILEARLGAIPVWAEPRIAVLSADEAMDTALRASQTSSYEELFSKK